MGDLERIYNDFLGFPPEVITKCEDCQQTWTVERADLHVNIFIMDMRDIDSSSKKEKAHSSYQVTILRSKDRSCESPQQLVGVVPKIEAGGCYQWRVNHKGLGTAAPSGCKLNPMEKSSTNESEKQSQQPVEKTNMEEENYQSVEKTNVEEKELDKVHKLQSISEKNGNNGDITIPIPDLEEAEETTIRINDMVFKIRGKKDKGKIDKDDNGRHILKTEALSDGSSVQILDMDEKQGNDFITQEIFDNTMPIASTSAPASKIKKIMKRNIDDQNECETSFQSSKKQKTYSMTSSPVTTIKREWSPKPVSEEKTKCIIDDKGNIKIVSTPVIKESGQPRDALRKIVKVSSDFKNDYSTDATQTLTSNDGITYELCKGLTNRGQDCIIDSEGHVHNFVRGSNNDTVYWRCNKRSKSNTCYGRLVQIGRTVTLIQKHICVPKPGVYITMKIEKRAKEMAIERSLDKPIDIAYAVLAEFQNETESKEFLPKAGTLSAIVKYFRGEKGNPLEESANKGFKSLLYRNHPIMQENNINIKGDQHSDSYSQEEDFDSDDFLSSGHEYSDSDDFENMSDDESDNTIDSHTIKVEQNKDLTQEISSEIEKYKDIKENPVNLISETKETFQLYKGLSNRGRDIVISSDGHMYTFKRKNKKRGMHWQCFIRNKNNMCSGSVLTIGNVVMELKTHTCTPKPGNYLAIKVRAQTKQLVAEFPDETENGLAGMIFSCFQEEVKRGDMFPSLAKIKYMIRHYRDVKKIPKPRKKFVIKSNGEKYFKKTKEERDREKAAMEENKIKYLLFDNEYIEPETTSIETYPHLTFEMCRGLLQTGKDCIISSEGHVHNLNRTTSKFKMWQCVKRNKVQRCGGAIKQIGNIITFIQQHTCVPKSGAKLGMQMRKRVKELAVQRPEEPAKELATQVFNECSLLFRIPEEMPKLENLLALIHKARSDLKKLEAARNPQEEVPLEPEEYVTYELCKGYSKKGQDVIIDSKGHVHNFMGMGKKGLIWQCSKRSKTQYCNARLLQNGSIIKLLRKHTCTPTPGSYLRMKVGKRAKELSMLRLGDKAHEIASEVLDEFRDVNMLKEGLPSVTQLTSQIKWFRREWKNSRIQHSSKKVKDIISLEVNLPKSEIPEVSYIEVYPADYDGVPEPHTFQNITTELTEQTLESVEVPHDVTELHHTTGHNISDIHSVTDVHNDNDVHSVTDIQNVANVQSVSEIQNVSDVHDISEVQNISETHGMSTYHIVSHPPNISNLQNSTDVITYEYCNDNGQKGHDCIIDSEGHIHNIGRRGKNSVTWLCSKRKSKYYNYCKGKLKQTNDSIITVEEHTCIPVSSSDFAMQVRQRARELAAENWLHSANDIAIQVINEYWENDKGRDQLPSTAQLVTQINYYRTELSKKTGSP